MPSRGRRGIAFIGACLVLVAAVWAVASRGPEAPASLEERVRDVASSLRCPVCQQLSVADSPSGLAAQMRATIQRKLLAGEGPEQIRRFYVRAYGDWILLSPPSRGLGGAAWAAPVAALVLGGLLAGVALGRWARRHRPSPVTEEDRQVLRSALASFSAEEDVD